MFVVYILGFTTGDMYSDSNFRDVPGFAPIRDDRAVVVKTHDPFFHRNYSEFELKPFQRSVETKANFHRPVKVTASHH